MNLQIFELEIFKNFYFIIIILIYNTDVVPKEYDSLISEPKSDVLPITPRDKVFTRESIKGIEPSSSVWKTDALTVVLYRHIAEVTQLLPQNNYHNYKNGSSILFEIKSSGL